MESWRPAPIQPDPAPALTRGMAILAVLASEGAATLEAVVRISGFPKTSVLRLLTTLCDCGAVQRDERTKRYSTNVLITPRVGIGMTLIHRARQVMATLSQQFGHTCELYRAMPLGLTMVERVEPEDASVVATARMGHYRNLLEIESLSLVYRCWASDDESVPNKKLWQWDAHCKKMPLKLSVVKQLLKETRAQGSAFDRSINPHGVRRYSVPIFADDQTQKLWGILAIAQVVHPSNLQPSDPLIQTLTEAGHILCGHATESIFLRKKTKGK